MNQRSSSSLEAKTTPIEVAESTLLVIASAIPIVSSLATGWSEYKNHKQTNHIESILNDFAQHLKQLDDNVDKAFLASEEAKRLVERTVTVGKDELREEKRKMLSEFLANSFTTVLAGDSEKDLILDTIERLSPLEFALLKRLTELLVAAWGKENVQVSSDYNPDDPGKPTIGYMRDSQMVGSFKQRASTEIVEACLEHMVSIGVIEGQGARGWSTVGGKMGVKAYRPTKLGLKTLEYLGVSINDMRELRKPPQSEGQ